MNIGITEAIQHFFSNPSFDLIYSEAVANAFDAGAKNINIKIRLDSFNEANTLQLEIEDDGCGFTNKNFEKFSSLLKKSDNSHKGLGRLIFLQYFNNVLIESVYDNKKKRIFTFNESFDGSNFTDEQLDEEKNNYTKLIFKNFSNQKLNTYSNVRAISIKEYLLSQFLPRLLSMKETGIRFTIQIETDVLEENRDNQFYSDSVSITEADLPEMEEIIIKDTGLDLFDDELKMLYTVDEDYNGRVSTAICVDERAIEIQILKNEKIPEKINGIFLLQSDFFNSKVDDSRQELLLNDYEKKLVEKIFLEKISEVLNDKFPEIAEKNKETSKKLCSCYPHLEGYFSNKSICLIDENKTLEEAQSKFFKEQKEVLGAKKLTDKQYEMSLNHATRVLTEYVLYRNIIIEKLKNITGDEKEAKIHNLIVPMQQTFSSNSFINDLYNNNAWLLDDKYMSYRTILSDENMSQLISKISEEEELQSDDLRPDIAFVFSDDINQVTHPVDVVIVELKKKGLGYLGNYTVVKQLEQRARRLLGLYPDKIQRMWFFGIVEFDKELKIEMSEDWTPLYSTGEVYYKTRYLKPVDKNLNIIGEEKPVSITLMSFDALWQDAKLRNETLLTILRESIKKYSKNFNEDSKN